ncbi:hypothetical protein PoB_002525300 [Plakobranchus ocellatus]|uniref:C-type lectin domain-containing protein n=1 Tax=Plakobranchus ocellatus TaxID=259542 RepID=A0AAV3ZV42_9GAST|nr:hypothetical protein PoB_002525300 [Plakobranchus ocellatus]
MASSDWTSPSCSMLWWPQLPTVVTILLLMQLRPGSEAQMIDFYLILNKQSSLSGTQACKDRGYDGLAVLSTPEVYSHAVEFTKFVRSTGNGGVNVGLTFRSGDGLPIWADGTSLATDTPRREQEPDAEKTLYARLNNFGKLYGTAEHKERYSLCGNCECLQSPIVQQSLK